MIIYIGNSILGLMYLIPQFLKDKSFPVAYKLLAVSLFLGALLPEYLTVIIPFVVFVFCVTRKNTERISLKGDKFLIIMSVYAVYLAVTAFWAKVPKASVMMGIIWIGATVCAMTIISLCDTREKIENIMLCLVGTAAANSIIAIIQMCFMAVGRSDLFPNPLYQKLDEFVYGLVNYDFFFEEVRDRVAACFENPLIFATFLVMVFPIAAYCCFYTATKKRRAFSIICSLLIFFGILFTFLRGAAVAIIVSFMVLSFAGKKPAKFMSGLAAAASLIIMVTIFERRGVAASQDLSTNYRIGLWGCTFGLIKGNFLFGVGAGYNNVTGYLFENGLEFSHSHNLFIEVLAEGGIIGLGLFGVLLSVVAYDFFKLCRMTGWYRSYGIAFLSSLSGFTVMSLFDNTLCTPKQILCFSVLAGFMQAALRIKTKTSGDRKNEGTT